MTRIFSYVALFAVATVAANLLTGFLLGDIRVAPTRESLQWATVHRLGGVAAALAVVFANSLVITYFVGTGRWVREVSETYLLDPHFVQDATRVKRRTFPWAVASMLAVVGLIALGGAADPSTGQPNTEAWVMPHMIAAFLVLSFLGWASVVEWNNLQANHEVILAVLADVKRIRVERGLEIENAIEVE